MTMRTAFRFVLLAGLGLIWLAYVLQGRALDDSFLSDVRSFFTTFYHVAPTDEQLRALIQEGP